LKFGKTDREVEVNIKTKAALFLTIRDHLQNGTGFALATLNLDHLTKLPVDDAFLAAYRAHDMVVADGRPIIWMSQLAGVSLELMPGSDMIIPLCEICAEMDAPIALIGSSDDALGGAADALKAQAPGLQVTFINAPPYGFDPEGAEADAILGDLARSSAAVCFIALGAPKQELFAARGRKIAPDVGFASIGAGLDFLSGHQVRAPKIMRMFALELLWRAAQSPRRMVPRYAKCFAILPGLALQALKQR
jgi:N-acetylglucosaminyldiphosphoundecaprenol N-acetyl-beta-D-mannosaminyltransferase